MSNRLKVAILGTGNIGTDLLIKVVRSRLLECRLFAGRNLASPGMLKANQLGVPVSAQSLQAIHDHRAELDLVFDATSAHDHLRHAPVLRELGLVAVDLTPAKVGKLCVPAVNLEACLEEPNVNMVSCGGQASIPIAFAIAQTNPQVEYIETISSIASRSAGPATRINLDEYLMTTEEGLQTFSRCPAVKAILNLNPAQPCVHMQTTVLAMLKEPNLPKTRMAVASVVKKIQRYVPGYQLILPPMIESNRLVVMVRVEGHGDYLPKYAGNLDIINCAAIAIAEAHAIKRGAA
ncbi:MAG: acetaldehyde dehydrogenase (acetylating) [Pedosphaera sp.]|nr:acetaldehyde dehydrogenase (acetylating) [Pedosphaera sp.]